MPKLKKKDISENLIYLAYIIIPSSIYVVFFIIPNFQTILFSLYQWNGISSDKQFVGLQNYVEIFSINRMFWKATGNTFIYTLYLLILNIATGLLLALALKQNRRLPIFFRGIFFAPGVLATIAVGYMWKMSIYDANFGALNAAMKAIGLGSLTHIWLAEKATALPAIVFVHVWMSMGFSMVMFIDGMNNISEDVYEAALIAGAGPLRTFFSLTLPLLKETISTVMLLTIISGFTSFDFVYVMTDSGGLGGMTEVLSTLLYRQGFAFSKVGVSSAISVFLMLMILVIVQIQNKLLQER